MTADAKSTPMLQQYGEIRRSLPKGTLLLFRLGDFYEMFNEDAETGSRVLGITLTRRNGLPMAGIPFHAAESYLARLLAAGVRVALCEQTEPAKAGKLVRREVTRILTPGTALEASQLDERSHRHLAALDIGSDGKIRASWLDLSTSDFEIAADEDAEAVLALLAALVPAEILVPETAFQRWQSQAARSPALAALLRFLTGRTVCERPDFQFDPPAGALLLRQTLGVLNLDGFGIPPDHPALGAAGALIAYTTESLRTRPANLRLLRERRISGTLLLDPATLRNLEVLRSVNGRREGSLLDAVDATVTGPGARQLESWLAGPQLDLAVISQRHACVGDLVARPDLLERLRAELRGVRDVVRILSRLENRLHSPRELGGLRDSLRRLPALVALVSEGGGRLAGWASRITPLPELALRLEQGLADELPQLLSEGGTIRAGFDAELDRVRGLAQGSRTWLTDFERTEQERTGIRSLKVRYNANFGYFIEVTKANLHLVPADYVRRQTTVGGERFTTDALREREREILASEDQALQIERTLFQDLVQRSLAHGRELTGTAHALAELDVLAGWARLAIDRDYCRPEVDDSTVLNIEEGRHPVVEAVLRSERDAGRADAAFVPNDTRMDAAEAQVMLLTGPNMAGKSTYIRQVALLVLLAQVGCWVPARAFRAGWVDRVFSRIGASDDLARGNSTFMVEMNETANILHHATARSLVVLDEIGRGTSTYDGLSIAWSVVEHLHGNGPSGPRTLFATHYHELIRLADSLPRLRNHTVEVKEWNDEILFLRKVVPGAADRSYGIQVARLAGLPEPVIHRAREILGQLTVGDASALPNKPSEAPPETLPRRRSIRAVSEPSPQLELFPGDAG